MSVTRGILLDFYGTVVHEDDVVVSSVCAEVHAGIADREDVSVREIGSSWWRTFSAMCADSAGPTFRTQRELERLSLRRTIERFGSAADAEELSARMFAYWQRPDLFEDARSFLAEVDRPVCVVSNIDRDDVEAAIAFHGLAIQLLVTSEDVRAYKPRPECFLAGLEKLGLAPHEVVHVGDSLSSDVAGANALGIPAVWVNRGGRRRPDTPPRADERADLVDLAGALR